MILSISIKKRTQYTLSEQLFHFVWIIYSISSIIGISDLEYEYHDTMGLISKFCRYFILLVQFTFLINMFMTKLWQLKKILLYFFFLALVSIVEIRLKDSALLMFTFFILLGQTIDLDRLLKYDIKIKIFFLFVILSMCALGIVENRADDYQSGYKMALGFGHPNIFASYVMTILVEWLCIRYRRMRRWDWLEVIAILTAITFISNARSSVFTFSVIMLLFFLANYFPQLFRIKPIQFILIAIAPLMAFISFYLVKLYSIGNEIAIALNVILSNRISLSYQALSVKGIKLFGQDIAFSSQLTPGDGILYFLIDNAYIRMSLRWGAIMACFIIIMYMHQFAKLIKFGRIDLLLMSAFFLVLGFGESHMIIIFYNISLLCILGVPRDVNNDRIS